MRFTTLGLGASLEVRIGPESFEEWMSHTSLCTSYTGGYTETTTTQMENYRMYLRDSAFTLVGNPNISAEIIATIIAGISSAADIPELESRARELDSIHRLIHG